MTTSQTSFLSEILSGQPIPIGKLAYFRARLSNRIHELVLSEFMRLSEGGKITKAELAKRIGRKPEQVTRWLGASGNWTIETLSDLLLAMGREPKLALIDLVDQRPLEAAHMGSPRLGTPTHETTLVVNKGALAAWRKYVEEQEQGTAARAQKEPLDDYEDELSKQQAYRPISGQTGSEIRV